jgi:hypothetical protein
MNWSSHSDLGNPGDAGRFGRLRILTPVAGREIVIPERPIRACRGPV